MSVWAIIRTGGKQYKIAEGQTLNVEKLAAQKDGKVSFEEVMAVERDGKISLGSPILKDAKVTAKVIENLKGPKVKVVKFKSKSRYLKTYGHRQQFSKVFIEKIQA